MRKEFVYFPFYELEIMVRKLQYIYDYSNNLEASEKVMIKEVITALNCDGVLLDEKLGELDDAINKTVNDWFKNNLKKRWNE